MAKGKLLGEARIVCKVSRGMFTDERVVTIELPDGRQVSAIVDKSAVEVSRQPQPREKVPGKLRVFIVKDSGSTVLLELPRPTVSAGSRLLAPRSIVVAPG